MAMQNMWSVILLRELGIRKDMFMATKVDREDQEQGKTRMKQSFEGVGWRSNRPDAGAQSYAVQTRNWRP